MTNTRDMVRRAVPVCVVLAFVTACSEDSGTDPDTTRRFTVVAGACGVVEFKEVIGTDSASAVAVIESRSAELFGKDTLTIEPQRLEVIDKDGNTPDARFYAIGVLDPDTRQHVISLSDVVTTRGERYQLHWCLD
jgi:hypothetical protein